MRNTRPSNSQRIIPDAAPVTDVTSAPDSESLMSGSRRGVSRSRRQLEIFPLHPGTNPARPAGDPRRPDPFRRRTVPSRFASARQTVWLHCFWSVARDAWSAVARTRARRQGAATVLEQGTATVMPLQNPLSIAAPAVEASCDGAGVLPGDDPDRMSLLEKVLATMGFPVGLLLLFSVL